MGMSKKQITIFTLVIIGCLIFGIGIYLKVEAAQQIYSLDTALDPTKLNPVGQRLDLINNLYFREMHYDEGPGWRAGQMYKLGQFYGAYMVGYEQCRFYVPDGADIKCNVKQLPGGDIVPDTVRVIGFGMLVQRAPNQFALVVPLNREYLESLPCHPNDCDTPTDQGNVMPWFIFGLKGVSGATGHEWEQPGDPVGLGLNDVEFPGYISLEVRLDLRDQPPYPAE